MDIRLYRVSYLEKRNNDIIEAYLGRLDVVMEIVTEGLDVRDIFVASLRSQVSREKDCELSIKARSICNEVCLPKVT